MIGIPGYLASYKTGSNYTVDPPVTNTDIDFLVLVTDLKFAMTWCIEQGYDLCEHLYGSDVEDGMTFEWMAFRKGEINLILQSNVTLYVRSCAATELCRALNVKSKEDRIALFRSVKYGAVQQLTLNGEPMFDESTQKLESRLFPNNAD